MCRAWLPRSRRSIGQKRKERNESERCSALDLGSYDAGGAIRTGSEIDAVPGLSKPRFVVGFVVPKVWPQVYDGADHDWLLAAVILPLIIPAFPFFFFTPPPPYPPTTFPILPRSHIQLI